MIRILKTVNYDKELDKFARNNLKRGNLLIKALDKFSRNPQYPGLNLEKLKNSKYWTIRIDKSNRIFFVWIDKTTALFVDIGKHDKYRKY